MLTILPTQNIMSMSQKIILLIESDTVLIEIIQLIFPEYSYQIKVEQFSADIINKVNFIKPDIILIDSHVSGKHLTITTHLLKQHRCFYKIPIIIMSTDLQVEKLAVAAGADDFLTKPFNICEFEDKVLKYLNQHDLSF